MLKSRNGERRELVSALSALDADEWEALATEARADSLIPLAHLVAEGLAHDIGTLACRLGDEVVVDDIGRRCITRAVARRLFTEHAERQEREKARRKAEDLAARARPHPIYERVRALQKQQEMHPSTGWPTPHVPYDP